MSGSSLFSALIDEESTSQRLFVLRDDDHAEMRVLFQAGDSKLWTTTDFAVPAIQRAREVYTYTTHIKIQGSIGNRKIYQGDPLLSSSSVCITTVNGRNYQLSCNPIKVKLDMLSAITVIIEVDDLNAPYLRLSGVSGCDTTYIDLSSKVLQFLQGIKSGVDLQRAELPNGGNVVSGTPSQQDLNGAASTLSTLVERAERMDPRNILLIQTVRRRQGFSIGNRSLVHNQLDPSMLSKGVGLLLTGSCMG